MVKKVLKLHPTYIKVLECERIWDVLAYESEFSPILHNGVEEGEGKEKVLELAEFGVVTKGLVVKIGVGTEQVGAQ